MRHAFSLRDHRYSTPQLLLITINFDALSEVQGTRSGA